jgi:Na+-translocating ferredoxin:NAD+ oxidoreductase RnfG subunit
MADIAAELQNHTGTLTVLVGWLAGICGIFIGAATTLIWRRITKVEDRQAKLREEVLPQLITKDDFNQGVEVLKEVAQVFVARVETFMTACSEGKCFMAKMIQIYHGGQGQGVCSRPPKEES